MSNESIGANWPVSKRRREEAMQALRGQNAKEGADARRVTCSAEAIIPGEGWAYQEVWCEDRQGPIYLRVRIEQRVAELARAAGAIVLDPEPLDAVDLPIEERREAVQGKLRRELRAAQARQAR